MKSYKNYLSAGSGAAILLVSFVLGVPRATPGSDIKAIAPLKPGSLAQRSATRLPASGGDDLAIDASLGDEHIVLERKKRKNPQSGHHIVVISVIAVLIATRPSDAGSSDEGGPRMIDLRATINGADAVPGSLLYALAWLAGDTDPLASVRALVYDIDVSREHDRPCSDGPRSQMCLERARRLATLVDATLALGSPDEQLQFRQGASALGVAPDCVARATLATPTTSRATLSDRSDDLSIDSLLGDEHIVLERKKQRRLPRDLVVIKVIDMSSSSLLLSPSPSDDEAPQMIDLRATITGDDALQGSLLYALSWLAGDVDPLGSVRALGYDINVSKERDHPCTDELSSEVCVDHTGRFATLLDATLALGSPGERQ